MRVIVGDLWEQPGAKVIPTNLRGVMGRGLAKQARDKYPGVQEEYQKYLRQGTTGPAGCMAFRPGRGGLSALPLEASTLVLLPVKDHWGDQVDLNLVKAGLEWLGDWPDNSSDRVSVPALGCGFGEGDPLVLLPTIIEILDRHGSRYLSGSPFTLVLASPEVGTKYEASFRPGARTDRRFARV